MLAAHLVALGFLPFVVTGASFHLLPVMLRNDVRHPERLRLALPLLAGGFLVAPGLAFDNAGVLWPGAVLVAAGLLLVLSELIGLVCRASGDRMLVASRTGVALVTVHVAAALVLGALVFSHGDEPYAGVDHGRWLLVHLHLAVLGWLTLLIVTVGRTLAPMLALAPTAPVRRLPGRRRSNEGLPALHGPSPHRCALGPREDRGRQESLSRGTPPQPIPLPAAHGLPPCTPGRRWPTVTS